MNWMLPRTAGLQTKDKPCIYLSLLPPWKMEGGCCGKVLATGQNSSIREDVSALVELMGL